MEISAKPQKGFHWDYFIYIPDSYAHNKVPLIVITNNTPENNDDYAVHLENAKHKILQFKDFSEQMGMPLLIYAIPNFMNKVDSVDDLQEDLWLLNVQTLTRNSLLTNIESLKRMDEQLICVINDAKMALLEMVN